MYKSILKLQRLKTTIVLNRLFCESNYVHRLNKDVTRSKKHRLRRSSQHYLRSEEQTELLQFKSSTELDRLKEKSSFKSRRKMFDILKPELRNDYRIKQMYLHYNDSLSQALDNCVNLFNLLNLIKSQITELKLNHIELIYDKLSILVLESKNSLNDLDYLQLLNLVRTSNDFKLLLKRTMQLIRELDKNCLMKQLKALHLINQNPESKIFKITLEMLKHKMNDLELDQIYDCLNISFSFLSSNYSITSNNSTSLSAFFSAFNHALLLVSKNQVLSNRFNFEDTELVSKFFIIFLIKNTLNEDLDVILRLSKALLLEKNELNLKQACNLLKAFKAIEILPKELENGEDKLKAINRLIKKCNTTIYESLALRPTKNDIYYFLDKLHGTKTEVSDNLMIFENYYDSRILNNVSPFLISTFNNQDKFKIMNLALNYFDLGIFNDKLMQLLYEDLISSNLQLNEKFNPFSIFYLFTYLKLPFVDANRLFDALFNSKNNKLPADFVESELQCLKRLCLLILNDIDKEEALLSRLVFQAKSLGKKTSRNLTFNLCRRFFLSKIYFSLFKNSFKDKLRIEADLKLIANQLIIYNSNLKSTKTDFDVNHKIQKRAYLANVFINYIAIYDKNEQELIALDGYSNYFNRLDQISLGENQELNAFVFDTNTSNYETNFNYQFKKVLNHFNFKIVEVRIS